MHRSAMNTNEFFKGLFQLEHKDYDVRLPIFYYDNSAISAIYTASTKRLRKYLPLSEMHPVEMFPGRALMVFTAFEYRRTDLGPYNEFSVSAIITFGKPAIPGVTSFVNMARRQYAIYILHLPVTSERARRGGVEMAGYPKFIADITFARENEYTTCTLAENGERILSLRGQHVRTSPGRLTKYVIYTVKDGIPLSANLYVNPLQFRQTAGASKVRVDIASGHRMCTQLQDLGLSKRPILYQYMPSYEAILCGSRNLIDD